MNFKLSSIFSKPFPCYSAKGVGEERTRRGLFTSEMEMLLIILASDFNVLILFNSMNFVCIIFDPIRANFFVVHTLFSMGMYEVILRERGRSVFVCGVYWIYHVGKSGSC